MGQFEYSVALSPVKPHEIEQLAKDYLVKKRETQNMIKHEFDTLVLDSTHSKSDQDAINAFIHEQILLDRKRIVDELARFASNGMLTIPIFQLKQIVAEYKDVQY